MTTHFYLKKVKKIEPLQRIYATVILVNGNVFFSAKVDVHPKDWDKNRQRVKCTDKMAKDKNLILEQLVGQLNEIFVQFRLKNKELTKEMFWRVYNRPSTFFDFYQFAEDYTERIKHSIEYNTIRMYEPVFNKLKTFCEPLYFEQITPEFLNSYKLYLKKRLGNADTTANKNLAVIKKFVLAAYREGFIEKNPFEYVKINHVPTEVVYLNEFELQKMVDYYKYGELTNQNKLVLQLFLFMCFSSQHIGDAKKMRIEQLNGNTFTYYRMKLANSKPAPVVVPISNSLRKIVCDVAGVRNHGLLFEKLPCEQKINSKLKELALLAGVSKPISCKTARHTFATFFLSKTKDINSLKSILGHSNINQTLTYAHVLESEKERGVSCFDVFQSSNI